MATATVIVVNPVDETLWCGGLILKRPSWHWFIMTLCKGSDPDRADQFERVLAYLGAEGTMSDLDDTAKRRPSDHSSIRHVIREGLPRSAYDFVFTHGLGDAHTHHPRHEECYRAVASLRGDGQLQAGRLMSFVRDDLSAPTIPGVGAGTDEFDNLDPDTLARKRHIITKLYGFDEASWESSVAAAREGFQDIEDMDKKGQPESLPPFEDSGDSLIERGLMTQVGGDGTVLSFKCLA